MLNINNKYYIFFLGLFFIVLSHFPFLQFDFLYTDDYLYLFPKVGDASNYSTFKDIELFWNEFHYLGRPLGGNLILIQHLFIENIQIAKFFRFLSLILISVIFYIFFLFFIEKDISKKDSFLISFSIISLPTFNLTISWLTLQQSLFSIIFSILSFLIIKNINKVNSFRNLPKICLSILLLTFSIMFYQITSMFFFILYFLEIFFIYKKNKFKINFDGTIIILPIIIFFTTLFVCFVLQKVYYNSTGSIEINQLKKFYWFCKDIIPLSISFFYPNKSFILTVIFFIFIYSSIFKAISFKYKKKVFYKSFLILLFIIFYSYFLILPLIIADGYYTSSFRIIIVISSFYLIIFIFSFKFSFNKKIVNYFLAIIFLLSFFTNYYHSYRYLAGPQSKEFSNMKSILKEKLNSDIKYIHILRPNWWSGNIPLKIFSGSDYGIYSSSVTSSIKSFIYLSLKEIELNPKNFIVSSSVKNPVSEGDGNGDPIPSKKNLLIIDFTNPID